jgi:REP element-mobilizing transposase RayT
MYHVGARGNRKSPIFRDDDDRRAFLWRLARVAGKNNWSCLGYCLMTNHVHLLLLLEEGGLSCGMQQLLGGYSRAFNQRYELQDHTFKQRFFSERIERESQFLEVCRYVVLNPVRAGLCASPGEWPWSSYGACAGDSFGPDFLAVDRLLAFYADEPVAARRRYRAAVAAAARRDVRPRNGNVTS